MSWQDILNIIATAIASVGGAGAIVWALSSFFGKMWANKLLEKQKAEYQKDIEEYKSALSCELENVKATNEKLTYISKIQYDIEISAIRELTRASHQVLMMCFSIIPFDEVTLKKTQEIINRNQKHYNNFVKSFNSFMDVYGSSLPFIEDKISKLYDKFIVLCREQFDCYNQAFNPQLGIPKNYVNSLYKKDAEIDETYYSAINAIKEYLKKIKVDE